jgi:hypothetical protein
MKQSRSNIALSIVCRYSCLSMFECSLFRIASLTPQPFVMDTSCDPLSLPNIKVAATSNVQYLK